MQVEALYLASGSAESGDASPVEIQVRVHYSDKALGDQAGTNFHFAEREEIVPRLIFMRAQITPVRGAIVSVENGEAYRIDHLLPPDDITVTAEVIRLPPEDTFGLPIPGESA